ncbi:MAG: cell division protein FtsL [Thermodesulfobacteriota bacterium]|nr:cell division protein FtsL [Thermodesulfobacteriota bacterium]
MKSPESTMGRSGSMGIWVALIVIFMAQLLVYSWCRVQYVQTGFEIEEARQTRQRLTELHRKLKIEEAWLRSRERIKPIAEERGLEAPDPSKIFVLK